MNLNSKEEKTYTVIEKVVNGEMTRKEAMIELNKSRQQIYRLIIIYHSKGRDGFIHGNRGKISKRKISRNIIEELERLYLEEYYDYNFEAFYDEIKNKRYIISYDVILKEFKRDDIISPLAHKSTIKLYTEKMNNAINNNEEYIQEEKVELFESRQIVFEKAHTRRISNMFSFGQEVQMDACEKNMVWWYCNLSSSSS